MEQYEAANCYDQWVRKQVHDLRKQIDYLRQHTDDGTILDYAKEVDERLIGLSLTGNADIDAFLRYKAKLARKSGIHLHVTGHLPTELPGDPMPVITLLANAVDNAIEGSMEVTDSIEKTVDVQFGFQDRRLYLSVRNPTKLKRAPEPPYRTTKTDKYQHGFGLYSIQETVDSYDGVLELSVANGVFHLFAILQMSESVLHRKEGVDCVS